VPQVKYTYEGPYGTALTAGFENPSPRMTGPFGSFDLDSQVTGTIAPCSVTANTANNLPATTACIPSGVFTDTLKSSWPDTIATARVNQPWGHAQIGAMVRNTQLNDGQYFDQSFVGYGGTVSGDVHPFSGTPGALGKDDIGFGTTHGANMGGQVANGVGPSTNFGAILNTGAPFGFVNPLTSTQWNTANSATRRAYDRVVRTSSSNSHTGWIWYQHWWTENLRSTLGASAIWNGIDTSLVPGQGNKFLSMTHANLLWSPVAFVDFGVEYQWGHRIAVTNFKGDAYGIQGSMRVRF
jgi:outer membrane DcaP-like protein